MTALAEPAPQPDDDPVPANVVPLARARGNPASSAGSPHETLKGEELARFNELVLKLELADGRPLHGPGRTDCARVFQTHPDGFAAAREEALDAHVDRHCGLLVRLVRDAEWIARAEQLAAAMREQGGTGGNRFAAYDD